MGGKQAAKRTTTLTLLQQSATVLTLTVLTIIRTHTPLLMVCQSSWKLGRGKRNVVCMLFRKQRIYHVKGFSWIRCVILFFFSLYSEVHVNMKAFQGVVTHLPGFLTSLLIQPRCTYLQQPRHNLVLAALWTCVSAPLLACGGNGLCPPGVYGVAIVTGGPAQRS